MKHLAFIYFQKTKYKHTELNKLCEFSENQKWKLQYRATRDGSGAKDFHRKCNGISKILTFIKVTNGNVFGGFTEKAWSLKCEWVTDPKAFIFSLVNKEYISFKPISALKAFNAITCY